MLEHLADTVCGPSDAAGDAGDEALFLRLGGRFALARPGAALPLLLLLGYWISVLHLEIAVAVFRSLTLFFIFCHFLSRPPVNVKINIGFALQMVPASSSSRSLTPLPAAIAFS